MSTQTLYISKNKNYKFQIIWTSTSISSISTPARKVLYFCFIYLFIVSIYLSHFQQVKYTVELSTKTKTLSDLWLTEHSALLQKWKD